MPMAIATIMLLMHQGHQSKVKVVAKAKSTDNSVESHIKMNSCYMLAWTLDNNNYMYLAFRLRIQGILSSAGINCYSMYYEAWEM